MKNPLPVIKNSTVEKRDSLASCFFLVGKRVTPPPQKPGIWSPCSMLNFFIHQSLLSLFYNQSDFKEEPIKALLSVTQPNKKPLCVSQPIKNHQHSSQLNDFFQENSIK
jgi:hypothetical protein